jgi:hypothetical protein
MEAEMEVTDIAVARAERARTGGMGRAQLEQNVAERLSAELGAAIKRGGWVELVGRDGLLERVHVAHLLSDELARDELMALLLEAVGKSDCELVCALRKRFVEVVVAAKAGDLVHYGYDGSRA